MRKLNTVDRYDLSDTPLGLLLNDSVDLKPNKAVLGVTEQQGAIIVQRPHQHQPQQFQHHHDVLRARASNCGNGR